MWINPCISHLSAKIRKRGMWKTPVEKGDIITVRIRVSRTYETCFVRNAMQDQVFGTKMNIWFNQLTILSDNILGKSEVYFEKGGDTVQIAAKHDLTKPKVCRIKKGLHFKRSWHIISNVLKKRT